VRDRAYLLEVRQLQEGGALGEAPLLVVAEARVIVGRRRRRRRKAIELTRLKSSLSHTLLKNLYGVLRSSLSKRYGGHQAREAVGQRLVGQPCHYDCR
jgi:hypothetical protein